MNVEAVPVLTEPRVSSALGKHTMALNPCCLNIMTPDTLLVMYAGVHLDTQVRLGPILPETSSQMLCLDTRDTIQWVVVTLYYLHSDSACMSM